MFNTEVSVGVYVERLDLGQWSLGGVLEKLDVDSRF